MRRGNSILLLLLLAFVACTEDMTTSNNADSNRIYFSVSMQDEEDNIALTRAPWQQDNSEELVVMEGDMGKDVVLSATVSSRTNMFRKQLTRGTMVNSLDEFTNLADFTFGVSGCHYNTSETPLSASNANFFFNAQATYSRGVWWTSKEYYLPAANERLAFYAYWPYGCADITAVKGGNTSETGPMKITFKVNTTDLSQQTDLMTASIANQGYPPSTPVPLTFRHALTAINFCMGPEMAPGYVKSIELKNVCVAGEYTLSADGTGKGTWNPTEKQDIVLDFTDANGQGGLNTETASELLNASTGPLLMIPQTFDEDSQQLVIYINDSADGNDSHNDHYLTKKLSDIVNWGEGNVVTYKIGTSSINYLHVSSVDYPTEWGDETFVLKSAYDSDEAIGVYVVDETGKIVNANVRYYKTASGWTTESPASIPYKTTYKYYAYYPYTPNIDGGRAENSSFLGTDANDFFSGIISQWAVSSDQSTADKLLPNDLQIAKGTANGMTMVNFDMEHAMGLAELELDKTYIRETSNYKLVTDEDYKWSGDTLRVVIASDLFITYKPCEKDSTYYYITNGNVTFSATATDAYDGWKEDVSFASISSGSTAKKTALLKDGLPNSITNTNEEPYTMEVGDIFYTDGALSHSGSGQQLYIDKKPVALIFETSVATTRDTYANYKHGFGVALIDASSGTRWYKQNSDMTNTYFPNSKGSFGNFSTGLAKVKSELNGYTKYNYLVGSASNDAFTAVRDFANNDNYKLTRGAWYLPAIGEIWNMINGFGLMPTGSTMTTSLGIYYYYAAVATSKKLDAYFEKRAPGKYTPIAHNSTGRYTYIWSSSEYDASYAMMLNFHEDDYLCFNSYTKETSRRVRAFLAF